MFAAVGAVAAAAIAGTAGSLAAVGTQLLPSLTADGMPGPVAASLAAALAALGAMLTACALVQLRALPDFGPAPCARGHAAPAAAVTANPLSAAALPPLPPGWAAHGPDEKGDVWYTDAAGAATWERPRAVAGT